METVKPSTKGRNVFPKAAVKKVRGFLSKHGRYMPSDAQVKASIKARLNAQDDKSKS